MENKNNIFSPRNTPGEQQKKRDRLKYLKLIHEEQAIRIPTEQEKKPTQFSVDSPIFYAPKYMRD